ncbi:MAG: AEC family transporter [Lachnospiraceae bacterium]|nr:AEC family transporter [Lachnospiraceae bacterium]
MDNLIFALNTTIPIFLLMVVGYFLKSAKLIDDVFASKLNSFVFKVSLPVLVFEDLATVDFKEAWNGKFVLFCFAVTVASITISSLISLCLRSKNERGEFIQASYRSSAALLGLAFIQNIYGSSGLGPLMIIGSVPLYNICACIVLTITSPSRNDNATSASGSTDKIDTAIIRKTVISVLKNPIIIGIFVGLVWSFFHLPLPSVIASVVGRIGATATPLGLIAMGASFEWKKAAKCGSTAIAASFIKLIGYGALFLPVAIAMGYRKEELIAILVMLCSATTVSCYVMAKNMGHEAVLTSAVVMLTTFLSAFTLTGWLFILKTFSLI